MVSTSEVGKMDSFPDGLVVKKNARVVSLSVAAEVFPPRLCPREGPYWGGASKLQELCTPSGDARGYSA